MTSTFAGWWLPAATLWHRELVRFFRQRSRVIGALATPLVFWLLLGSGLQSSFRPPGSHGGGGFLAYFFPGTIAMILLFTAIFSNMSLIQDRNEGFLQSVLVAPISRSTLVMGKLLGGSTVALLQGLLVLLLSPLVGIPLTATSTFLAAGSMFLTALALSGLGFIFAWKLNSIQGFHAIMNLVLMPMWLLSGAFFPQAGASPWVRIIMTLNPLTYGMAALRQSLVPTSGGPDLLLSLGITAGFALATIAGAVAVLRGGDGV